MQFLSLLAEVLVSGFLPGGWNFEEKTYYPRDFLAQTPCTLNVMIPLAK